ncbi:hypothetical protein [Microcoleus sp. FACHB-68]|uniref:hypothetical protein n=1 Tax=Microcoleus sp. FACHB-68 TaxID=2692826 RepID=UPI0016885EC8|nr:hypothetical protein [Microcoleus sp. FACHB-68]MBD1939257.1 hypothetical protein [Microcoleus sp. FACHB-68]
MSYTFDILGVSPVLYFFNQQQEILQQQPRPRVEYVGTHKCTLDAFIESIETVSPNLDWEMPEVVDTVIDFWMNNSERIQYWRERLKDAGRENLLVARVGDVKSLQETFESLFGKNI